MTIPREQIQQFLCSIGHEPASKDQSSLCLVEDVVRALGEPTMRMKQEAAETVVVGCCNLKLRDADEVWKVMFAARFPPHVPKDE